MASCNSHGSLESAELAPLRRDIIRFLSHPFVENTMAAVIVLNLVLIIHETDLTAADDKIPMWLPVLSYIILVAFCLELLLRLYAERLQFFKEAWNIFDIIVIGSDVIGSFLSILFGNLFPVSLLRVLRLGKVARASKVFSLFPELRLMISALMGCFRAIFWGSMLVFFSLLLASILATQFLHPLAQKMEQNGDFGDCSRCGRAFATVMSSTLTFSQQIVAGDSWGTVSVPLIEEYPFTAFFFAAVFLFVGMALYNLILGVVVDVAQHTREKLADELEKAKIYERKESEVNLAELFKEIDQDGNGLLTKQELDDAMANNSRFTNCLEALDVSKDDVAVIWHLMDSDNSGDVSYKEFASELYTLKTSDTHFMVATIRHHILQVKDILMAEFKVVEQELAHVEEEFAHFEDSRRQANMDMKNEVNTLKRASWNHALNLPAAHIIAADEIIQRYSSDTRGDAECELLNSNLKEASFGVPQSPAAGPRGGKRKVRRREAAADAKAPVAMHHVDYQRKECDAAMLGMMPREEMPCNESSSHIDELLL